jgi:dimeric dUTPase (all-alpha-NTP-PPase superfamily)
MNSSDVPVKRIDPQFMLNQIFDKQRELEEKYKEVEIKNGALVPSLPLNLDTFEGQERARMLIYRITEELFEAGNTLRNKAWKVSQVPCDKDHFLEEISDSVHFLIQLFIELGLGPKEFTELYFRKASVNDFRIRSKY